MNWNQIGLSLYDSMGFVVGALLGIVIGVIVCLGNALVIHPAITNFWRYVFGDGLAAHPKNRPDAIVPEFDKDQEAFALVLSDLHVDTWESLVEVQRGETMLDRRTRWLKELLRWGLCKTRRLIINGDLLDAPPHPNNQGDPMFLTVPFDWSPSKVEPAENRLDPNTKLQPGVLQGRFLPALSDLNSFGKPTITTIGNHDMGINGLRALLPGDKGANWVPGILFETKTKNEVVFMEHGHLHDPILWVYVAYSLIDLLVRGDSSAGGQRGGRVGKAGGSTGRSQSSPGLASTSLEVYQFRQRIGMFATMTRFAYRMAAYRRLRELRRRYGKDMTFTAILMGHTHIPDRFQLTKNTVYVNLGDWAGNTEHQTFTVIKDDGQVVGPLELVEESTREARLL